jgi:hypothetical protein
MQAALPWPRSPDGGGVTGGVSGDFPFKVVNANG